MDLEQIIIRPETKNDYPKISEVTLLAFGQEAESILIKKLRQMRCFTPDLSLVAECNGQVIGHILFYPILIKDDDKDRQFNTLALAPMSVDPNYQSKGVGSKLVKEGIAQAQSVGFGSIIVVGHPEYYPRFGFQPASRFGIKSPFEVPDNAFMILEIREGALEGVKGIVEYPEPFSEV